MYVEEAVCPHKHRELREGHGTLLLDLVLCVGPLDERHEEVQVIDHTFATGFESVQHHLEV